MVNENLKRLTQSDVLILQEIIMQTSVMEYAIFNGLLSEGEANRLLTEFATDLKNKLERWNEEDEIKEQYTENNVLNELDRVLDDDNNT
jgi:hypothetical protein